MVKQKSIYFSACGIGLGHVGRLKPFARWLFQEGHKIYFTGYGEAMDQLKNDKFIKHTVPVIEFYENPDGSFNSSKTSIVGLYLTFRFLQQVKVEYQYITKYKPDLVVADTRYSTVFAAKKYKLACAELPILFITNQLTAILPTPHGLQGTKWFENMFSYLNVRIIGMADHVLIQDLPPPYTISTNTYPIPEWLQYRFQFIGFISRAAPEDLPERNVIRERYISDDRPLIYAPLAGPIGARKKLMELLKDALKNFDGKVIISMGLFGKKLDKHYGNVHVTGWVKDRFELLKAADLTIARPGLATIGDFLRFGVPSILVPTLNHPEQLHNAKSIERLGVGKILEQPNVDEKHLKQIIKNILEDTSVKKNTKKMQNIMIKHDGMKEVKNIIKDKLKQ